MTKRPMTDFVTERFGTQVIVGARWLIGGTRFCEFKTHFTDKSWVSRILLRSTCICRPGEE
eukprot:11585117-Karenia_brevis.AAC.1